MSIPRAEAVRKMVEEVSEAKLGALVLFNETGAEALSVVHGAAHARLLAFVGAVQPLDRATREKLASRLEAMADGLDDVKPSSLAGHQRDAVGAMIGEFRGLAAVLMQRPDYVNSSNPSMAERDRLSPGI